MSSADGLLATCQHLSRAGSVVNNLTGTTGEKTRSSTEVRSKALHLLFSLKRRNTENMLTSNYYLQTQFVKTALNKADKQAGRLAGWPTPIHNSLRGD
jgi:hypothetical protein